MALDQGTTSSRCILFNKEGEVCSIAQKEITQIYPEAGWVEHDPTEIWSTQVGVASEAMAKIGASYYDIASIGITNQRETAIVWNKTTGKPIYNAIVWQCRRTSYMVKELRQDGFAELLQRKTGLVPDAYFSATKIKWILDHVEGAWEEAKAGNLKFGTVDSWLIWNLTQGEVHATDYTNASRTMLYNIHSLCWDEEILERFQIPRSMLPEVKPSSGIFGYTGDTIFGGEIPIGGVAGDQQAALFGQGCFEKGNVKNTYGTGCFLLMNTGHEAIDSKHGLITTIAAGVDHQVQYVLEGSVFVAGAAIQWLRDELQVVRSAEETERYAKSVKDTNGVYVIPAFSGLGAPHWDQYARGTIVGITRGFNKAHLIRSTLESIAYQSYDVIQAMGKDVGMSLTDLKVDGGASKNDFLMQFQSDLLNAKVHRPTCVETTALGAAYLAGLATNYWMDIKEIKKIGTGFTTFSPTLEEEERQKCIEGWERAVKRSYQWAE